MLSCGRRRTGQDGRNRVDDIRTGGYSPTIRKRSLSRKLVELRKNCGLTTTQVQLQLNWSASKLNYIEKAKWIEPNSDAVADLCELYGVEGRERDALIQLAREGRQRGWWTRYNEVFSNELPGFEAGGPRRAPAPAPPSAAPRLRGGGVADPDLRDNPDPRPAPGPQLYRHGDPRRRDRGPG